MVGMVTLRAAAYPFGCGANPATREVNSGAPAWPLKR
jgi:hypothetical protein